MQWQNPQFTITESPIEPEVQYQLGPALPDQTVKFRLLDDDDNVYFIGYMRPTNSEVLFYPLDTVGAVYGCTKIQILDQVTWVDV